MTPYTNISTKDSKG